AYPAISRNGRHTASRTLGVSYLACASIGKKSRGGGRLFLSSIEQAPRLVDYKGSLDQTPLLSLLQSMQAQRATGTLQVRSGGEAFSLFFLFGHLFHAYGNGSQGEEVVFEPLAWRQGDYTFDPKSKLPTEETITAPTADILAEAKRRGVPGADTGPVAAVSTGRTAFSLFKNDVDRGEGSMDVIELTAEVVTAIYQLLTAPTILQGLLARFVDIRALLQYLQEEKIHGSLLVRAPDEMGI